MASSTNGRGVGAAIEGKLAIVNKTKPSESPVTFRPTSPRPINHQVRGVSESALYRLLASPRRAAVLRNPVVEHFYFAKTRQIHPDDVVINSSGLDIPPEIVQERMEQGRKRRATPSPNAKPKVCLLIALSAVLRHFQADQQQKGILKNSLDKSLPAIPNDSDETPSSSKHDLTMTPQRHTGGSDSGSSGAKTTSSLGSYKGDVIEIGTAKVAQVVASGHGTLINIPPRRYTGQNEVGRTCRIPTPTRSCKW